MEIRLLGCVEVHDGDGGEIPLASRRQRLLLAGLAARAGEVVTTDVLIELLWADALPDAPLAALQSQVSRLRRRLGPAAPIATTPSGYRLTSPEVVDAVRFRGLLAQARSEQNELPVLEKALALWRGRPMADLDSPLLEAFASALEDDYAAAAEGRVAALLGLGRCGEAAAVAGDLAARLPFREGPVAMQMEALARAGRHAEGLRVYEAFRRSLAEELGLDPSPGLADLYSQILGADTQRRPILLPSLPASSLVGRDADLHALLAHLARSRLVTLTGPGGVGKTRLALHVAHALASSYPDSVWFCDLATLPPLSGVDASVASVLGVDPRAREPLHDRIVAFLRPRRALVVLDNCEHVLEGVARLVSSLLAGAQKTTVLATSRERLRVPGEQRLPIEPLPATGDVATTNFAVQLFCQRAKSADPSFDFSRSEAEVAELCRVLGGLPLAIEVAAARTAARAPSDILGELRSHGGELRGERQRPSRHQSLHAIVAWSAALLDTPHRDAFERMAVFAGTWSLDAALAVAECGSSRAQVVADALDELAERSLTTVVTTGTETRWTMLEPVRAFAEARIRSRGCHSEVRDRHAAFFVALAEAASSGLVGPDERSWADRLTDEFANFRAAHRWLLDHGRPNDALRLASSCYPWVVAGAPAEVSGWAVEAIDRFGNKENPNLVGALATAAVGAWRQGDAEHAILLASRGVELADDTAPAARWALDALGDASIIAGHYEQALSAYRAAIPLAEACGDPVTITNDMGGVALALAYQGRTEEAIAQADSLLRRMASAPNPSVLGWAHYFAGEVRLESRPGEALPSLRRAAAEAERAGNRFLFGVALVSLVSLETRADDGAAPLGRYLPLITHWQQTGAWTQLWITMRSLIEALHRRGHIEAAAVLYGAVTANPTSPPLAGADATRLAEVVRSLVACVGDERFGALRAEGAAMADDEVLSYVLNMLADPAITGDDPDAQSLAVT